MSKLIYCATPARLSDKLEEIKDFVTNQGHGQFHPFQAFEYERFEGGIVGRERTPELCKRGVDICNEFWMFGVSEGTLDELVYALKKGKTVRLFLYQFDPEWKDHYMELGQKYGNPLEGILGNTIGI